MLTPPAPRSSTCAGPGGDTGTSGSMGTSEKCADVVVYTLERGPRGYMPAASQAPGVDEVGEELPRPREDRPGGEERVLLGGKHRHRPLEAPEFLLGGRPGEVGVQPEVPEGGPELLDGG